MSAHVLEYYREMARFYLRAGSIYTAEYFLARAPVLRSVLR